MRGAISIGLFCLGLTAFAVVWLLWDEWRVAKIETCPADGAVVTIHEIPTIGALDLKAEVRFRGVTTEVWRTDRAWLPSPIEIGWAPATKRVALLVCDQYSERVLAAYDYERGVRLERTAALPVIAPVLRDRYPSLTGAARSEEDAVALVCSPEGVRLYAERAGR